MYSAFKTIFNGLNTILIKVTQEYTYIHAQSHILVTNLKGINLFLGLQYVEYGNV